MIIHHFEIGDRVRVIRAYDRYLPLDAEFTVTSLGQGKNFGWIGVDNGLCETADLGVWPGGYWHDRFIKVNP